MTTKRIFSIAATLLCALLVAGPVFAEASAEKAAKPSYMRLAWWGNPTRDQRTNDAVAAYTAKYPNAEIEQETVGWSGYWDRINTQAAAGNLPDLMQHDYSLIYNWVQRGLLLDLTPYIKSGAIRTSKIADSFLSGGKFGDGIYGISLGTNALSVAIDATVLAKAGIPMPDTATWTWTDFLDIARTVYAKTGVQTMPIFYGDPRHGFENLLLQTGQTLFSTDGKALGFTDATVLRQFFETQLTLLDEGVLVKPDIAFVTVTPDEGVLAKGGTWVDWIWSNQLAATQAVTKDDLVLGLMPKIANQKRPGTYLKPSMFFAVTAKAENPGEAIKFLDYFVNDVDLNRDVLKAERGVPIPSDVRESLLKEVDDINKKIFSFIDLAGKNAGPIPLPDPQKSAEVVALIRNTTMEVLMKKVSVSDAVSRILTEGNRILAQ